MNYIKFFNRACLFPMVIVVSCMGVSYAETIANPSENTKTISDRFLDKKMTIELRDANILAIFEVLSQSSGMNFIFDRDVKTDLKTSIYATNATLRETLDLILKTNQLRYKIINEKTLLVYADSADKVQQYDELMVRSYVLKYADMKKIQDVLKTILNPKYSYIDERNKILTLRDRPDVLNAAEKMIALYDIAEPEVMLEVKVFEVSNDSLTNLGITIPNKVSFGPLSAIEKSSDLILNDLMNLSRGRIKVSGLDSLVTLNLSDTKGRVNVLASPSLRVKNKEKAKILVGDKVPVITSTINQVSSSQTESVSYLDVGLKLEVEPEILIDDQVLINLNLEVSNIVKEIRTTTGLLTYQIGTRNATTVLQLKEGETQILAGLIREEERKNSINIPFLSKIPLLGRLFSSQSKDKSRSEIVLSITPRIIRRSTDRLNHIEPFESGTQNLLSLKKSFSPNATFANTPPSQDEPASKPMYTQSQSPSSLPTQTTMTDYPVSFAVPASITSQEPLNIALKAEKILENKSSISFNFDRSNLSLIDVRIMAPATNNVSYSTTLQGIKIDIEKSLPASSPLALITLQPMSGYQGKTNLIVQKDGAAALSMPLEITK